MSDIGKPALPAGDGNPVQIGARMRYMRDQINRLETLMKKLDPLPTVHLDGEDLAHIATFNRHVAQAHASICNAIDEAAAFMLEEHDARLRAERSSGVGAAIATIGVTQTRANAGPPWCPHCGWAPSPGEHDGRGCPMRP